MGTQVEKDLDPAVQREYEQVQLGASRAAGAGFWARLAQVGFWLELTLGADWLLAMPSVPVALPACF